MAGLVPMGDLSHELETLFMQIDSGVVAADDRAFGLAQTSLDELARMRESVSSGKGVPTANALIAKIHALVSGEPRRPCAAPRRRRHPRLRSQPCPRAARTGAAMVAPAAADGRAAAAARRRASTAHRAGAEAGAGADDFRRACSQACVRAAAAARRTRSRAAGARRRVGAFVVRAAVHRDARRREGARVRGLQPRWRQQGHRRRGDGPLLPPGAVPPGREPTAPSDRPELARVDAELLDQLLNNAGEASIARARLEQQIGSIDFNVGELSRTVTRLKEQLRKLELETEAQILHRFEEEKGQKSDFDPLELDRYSSIQQFSRGLAETANDVGSIQQLLETLTQGHAEPADPAGAHDHRIAERPHAHAHGSVPASRAAPRAHRAPGRHRHGQEGRARRSKAPPASSTARCSSA